MKKIKDLEILLHKIDEYDDRSIIYEIIHKDFIEIGYSGNKYTYQDCITGLLQRKISDTEIHSQEYTFREIGLIIQVFYKTVDKGKNGEFSRYANRTSIWMKEKDNYQMIYHQATPTQNFTVKT